MLHGYRPHPAVILGIDAAKSSGWALLSESGAKKCAYAGVAKNHDSRKHVIRSALLLSKHHALPLIAVIEDFTTGGWKSFAAILRAGESRGRWLEHLDSEEISTINVTPAQWRGGIFGSTKLNREQAKTLAQTYVKSEYKEDLPHDAAEALLIARYGSRCPEIASLLESLSTRARSR